LSSEGRVVVHEQREAVVSEDAILAVISYPTYDATIIKNSESGIAEWQWVRGMHYRGCDGINEKFTPAEVDYTKAMYWFREAAKQGHVLSQYILGRMYDVGEGTSTDDVKAVHWYSKAAEQGNLYAQNRLGEMYEGGQGVSKNAKKAVHWFRKGAEGGLPMAQYNLADMYRFGFGVPQSYIHAYAWWSIAAAQEHDISKEMKRTIQQLMTPNQIAVAQKLSSELWEKKYVVPFQKD